MIAFRAIGTAGMQVKRARATTNPATLTALFHNPKTPEVRATVLGNQHAPLDILLASYRSDTSKEGATRARILDHPSIQAQLTMARESRSADELSGLSQSPIYEVRLEVARNTHTSSDVLARLAFEPPPAWDVYARNEIQMAAETNPNTSAETLTLRALGVIPRERALELVPGIEESIPTLFFDMSRADASRPLSLRPGVRSNPILAARNAGQHHLERKLDMLVRICRPSGVAAANEKVEPEIAAMHMYERLGPEDFKTINDAMTSEEPLFSASLSEELAGHEVHTHQGRAVASSELMLYDTLKDILSIAEQRGDQLWVMKQLSEMGDARGPALAFAARQISEFDRIRQHQAALPL